MRWSWASALAGLALAAPATSLQAQRVSDLGLVAVATAGRTTQVVAGPSAALRPSSRLRVEALAGMGARADHWAWRAELSGEFLLRPGARTGVGGYLGGGIALDGRPERGYAQLYAGLESAPGGSQGWLVELGVGGGVRLALGYCWRPGGR